MLTEEIRGEIVDRINSLDYSYEGKEYGVRAWRYQEGFRGDEPPYILIKFLPTIKKFESISDAIGYATEDKSYIAYQYCQVELVTVHCYARDLHPNSGENLNGRLLAWNIVMVVFNDVLKNWDEFLNPYHVYRDRDEDFRPRDRGSYKTRHGTRLYEYDIDVYLRTNLAWNKVPDDYEPGSNYVEEISGELISDNKNKYFNVTFE